MTATTRPDGTSDGDTQATPPPTPPPTTPAADPSAGASGASAPAAESGTYRVRFGMRAKMLTAFTFVFTVIFVIIGLFVVNYVGSQAQSQLVSQLQATAQGGAKTIDGNGMVQLRAQILGGDLHAIDSAEAFARFLNNLHRHLGFRTQAGTGLRREPQGKNSGAAGVRRRGHRPLCHARRRHKRGERRARHNGGADERTRTSTPFGAGT